MIRLSETTELTASAAEVHDFLVNMTPARYTAWHPHDHVRFTQVRDARDEHGCGQVVRSVSALAGTPTASPVGWTAVEPTSLSTVSRSRCLCCMSGGVSS